MIGRIEGRLLEKNPPAILVDVNGVGYEIDVPMSTFYQLPPVSERVVLLTHLAVREDAHQLYGFGTAGERAAFRELIRISGIGARTALSVLSGLSVTELAQAVTLQESGRLTRIPGIGKKTAERIGLELKGRLPQGLQAEIDKSGEAVSGEPLLRGDVLSALLNLGYHRALAEKALDAALRAGGEATFERTLKRALQELARG